MTSRVSGWCLVDSAWDRQTGYEALGFSQRQSVAETLHIVMEAQGGFIAVLCSKTRQD